MIKKIYVCYTVWIFLLIFVNSACITFWYEHSKVGIECPKNNVGKLYSLEWLSWNNPRAF